MVVLAQELGLLAAGSQGEPAWVYATSSEYMPWLFSLGTLFHC